MAYDPKRLRNLRIAKRLTQKGMAALLKIPYQNYQNYEKSKEKGGYMPKAGRMKQLADILETTTEYLSGQTDDPTRPVRMTDLDASERELILAWRRSNAERRNRALFELFRENNRG